MKKATACLLLFIAGLLFMTSHEAFAQVVKTSNAPPPTSEQSLQELVSEVRQLRATLQRINVAAYRAQVMVERLKLQQEQVARLSHELDLIHESLSEMKSQQQKMKQLMGRVEAGREAGIKNENDLAAFKLDLDALKHREQRLSERERQLSSELEIERGKLAELNELLSVLEQEMAPR